MLYIQNMGPHDDPDKLGERIYELRDNNGILATFRHQREAVERKSLHDGDQQAAKEIDRAADAARDAEEQPGEVGPLRHRQSLSSSLIEVLERVLASTRLTMTAQ